MYKVLEKIDYEKSIKGLSVTGNMVEIIGEQTVEFDDGEIVEQYIYNIIGYVAKNGKPFAALKDNIMKGD